MVLNFLSIVFYRAVSFIKLCRPYLSLVYFNTLYFCRQNFQWFLTEKMKIFSLNPFSEFQIEKVRSFDFSLILNVFISYSSCLSYWRSYAINFLCYSSCGQKILLDQSLLKEEEIMGVVTTWVGVPLYRFTFVIDDPKKVHRLLLWKRLLQSLPKKSHFFVRDDSETAQQSSTNTEQGHPIFLLIDCQVQIRLASPKYAAVS